MARGWRRGGGGQSGHCDPLPRRACSRRALQRPSAAAYARSKGQTRLAKRSARGQDQVCPHYPARDQGPRSLVLPVGARGLAARYAHHQGRYCRTRHRAVHIAAVSSDDAILEQLCPSVVEPWNDCRRIQRAMDRSRRATNLDNFDAKGRAIKGKRRWNRSQRYQALAASKRERDRGLAAERSDRMASWRTAFSVKGQPSKQRS